MRLDETVGRGRARRRKELPWTEIGILLIGSSFVLLLGPAALGMSPQTRQAFFVPWILVLMGGLFAIALSRPPNAKATRVWLIWQWIKALMGVR